MLPIQRLQGDGLPRYRSAPLVWVLTPLVAGLSLAKWLTLPPLLCLVAGMVLLAIARCQVNRIHLWAPLCLCGATLLALSYGELRFGQPVVPEGSPPREIDAIVEIERLFAQQDTTQSGLARIRSAKPEHLALAGQRLAFQLPRRDDTVFTEGEQLRIRGKLSWLHHDNTGFEAFLVSAGAIGKLTPAWVVEHVAPAPLTYAWAEQMRQQIRDGFLEHAASDKARNAALVQVAMVTGDKSALDTDRRHNFTVTGVMHLFVVSGLHIGVIAGTLAGLLRLAGLTGRSLALITLSTVAAYVWVIGAKPPAVRALLMIALWWGAVLLPRQRNAASALVASALLVLIFAPRQLMQTGFLLSYSVVGGLLWYGRPLAEWWMRRALPFGETVLSPPRKWLIGILITTWTATLFSAPLIVGAFGLLTPVGLLVNLFAVPLASLVIQLSFLATGLQLLHLGPLMEPINFLARQLIYVTETAIEVAAIIPGASWQVHWREPWLGAVTVAAMLVVSALTSMQPRYDARYFWLPPLLLISALLLGTR